MRKSRPNVVGFEDRRRGHEPRNVDDLSKLKMARKHAPRAFRKECILPVS